MSVLRRCEPPGGPEARMRWPQEGESMHDYAEHVIDAMERQGRVVRVDAYRGAVEENERLKRMLGKVPPEQLGRIMQAIKAEDAESIISGGSRR